jgi:feruloyl-CoA synthase
VVELLSPRLTARKLGASLVLSAAEPAGAPARAVGEWLVRWAKDRPDTTFLAERGGDGAWTTLSYAEVLRRVELLAGALLAAGATPERPVMILSDNSVAVALVMLAAMHAGVPAAPVSSSYSLASTTFERLGAVAQQLRPSVIFVDDRARYAAALDAVARATLVAPGTGEPVAVWSAADLEVRVAPSAGSPAQVEAARAAFAAITADTTAKVLFTSGSTGRPKGVVNTQRMLTSNQEALLACWPFLEKTPPVVVDWLPWSHTFGSNHNFFLVLRNGGSLYIDGGRPVPALIDTTLRNLADVGPTIWFNVPRGFDQATELLERDPALAARVFARLDVVFYAAAALSPSTRARLERVAREAGRTDVFFTSAWGSTETAPLATTAHFATPTTGNLGVPVPGVEIKLAPVDDRLEIRVRGPNVTPGYFVAGGGLDPATRDEDGFLPTGDAGRLVDPDRPEAGIVFAGRLAENFKLTSGTWVSVAAVRLALVEACAPHLLDAVIAGHDQAHLAALLFPSPAARALEPAALAAALETGLARHNREHTGTSERIARALVAPSPLSLDEGETTDKGYTNQRRVLERRAGLVAQLFLSAPSETETVLVNPTPSNPDLAPETTAEIHPQNHAHDTDIPPAHVPFQGGDSGEDMAAIFNASMSGWNAAMGLRFLVATASECVAVVDIDERHRQPYGIVHGGVYAGIIETVCSTGAAVAARVHASVVVGLENSTSFLHAARSGELRATARPLTRGRRTQVWEAKILDDDGTVAASGRVRLLVLEEGTAIAGSKVVA